MQNANYSALKNIIFRVVDESLKSDEDVIFKPGIVILRALSNYEKKGRVDKDPAFLIEGLPRVPLFSLGRLLILVETETHRKRCTHTREANNFLDRLQTLVY